MTSQSTVPPDIRLPREDEQPRRSSINSQASQDSGSLQSVESSLRSFLSNPREAIRSIAGETAIGGILSNEDDERQETPGLKLTKAQVLWPVCMWLAYCCLLLMFTHFTTSRWELTAVRNKKSGNFEFTYVQFAHMVAMTLFGITLVIGVLDFFWSVQKVKKHTCLWVSYVNAVAFVTYCYLFYYGTPILKTQQGEMDALRLLQWGFSTPGMIFITACLLTHRKRVGPEHLYVNRRLMSAVLSDEVMIVFGFMERYFLYPMHQVSFVAAMVAFCLMLSHFRAVFDLAAVELVHQQDRNNLRGVHKFTIFVWTLFPILRLCKMGNFLDSDTEEIGNTVLDLAAKLIYTLCLMFVNFIVIDQVMVDRINLARRFYEYKKTNGKVDPELETMYYGDQSEQKMLAYKEVEELRNERKEAMETQGYPSGKTEQLLESTLREYVALSSGDISSYLRNSNAAPEDADAMYDSVDNAFHED